MQNLDKIYPILSFVNDHILWISIILVILFTFMYLRHWGPLIVTYKKLNLGAQTPNKAYGKAACYDVFVSDDNIKVIPPNQWRLISTGLSFAPWPHFYIKFLNLTITPFGNVAGKIHTRSGLAMRKGVRAHLGIIDNDWRGEWSILLYNHGKYPMRINKGDKIAQIEFYRVPVTILWQRKKLSNTYRGYKGFGSSGK